MAYEYTDQTKISLPAGADLSAKQYCLVKLSGTGVVACSAVTDVPIGVLQNAPTSGKTAEIAIAGISKIKVGAAISAGTLIGTTTAGLALALTPGTDTTKYIIGQIVTASSAANDIVTATINALNPSRAA